MMWRVLVEGRINGKWHLLHEGEDAAEARQVFDDFNRLHRKGPFTWAAPRSMILTDDPAGQRLTRQEVYP